MGPFKALVVNPTSALLQSLVEASVDHLQILASPSTLVSALEDTEAGLAMVCIKMPSPAWLGVLRRARAQGIVLPIVILTDRYSERDAAMLMEAGASDCLPTLSPRLQPVLARERRNAIANGLEPSSDTKNHLRQASGRIIERSEQLQRSYAELQATLDGVPSALVSMDKDLRVRWLNQTALTIFELEREAVQGQHWFDLVPPMRARKALYERILAGENRDIEHSRVHFPGRDRYFDVHYRPVRDARGTIIGMLGIGDDVTEQLNIERIRARFESIMSATTDFVGMIDPDGTFQYINAAGRGMLGLEIDEDLDGFSVESCLPGRTLEVLRNEAFPIAIKEGVWASEVAFIGHNGQHIPTSTVLLSMKDASEALEYHCLIARDMTERRRFEQRLARSQSLEAIADLSRILAHDFKTHLSIIHHTSTLLDTQDEQERRRSIERIKEATEGGTHLLHRLLALGEDQPLRFEVLDLNALIRGSRAVHQRVVGPQIEIELLLDAELGRVEADATQMSQILMNLVSNARDAMPEGGTLTIETRNLTESIPRLGLEGGDYLVLRVSDTGRGMDEDTLSRVFDPFFTTRKEGTGLGLSIVYNMIQRSGGHIQARSRPGHGASFRILLPRVDDAGHPLSQILDPSPELQGDEVVLVVEENDTFRGLIHRVLSQHGYTAIMARSIQEAVEKAARQPHSDPVALLIVELSTKGLDPGALVPAIEAYHPDLRTLYLQVGSPKPSEGPSIPSEAILRKPFTVLQLLRRLREVLGD